MKFSMTCSCGDVMSVEAESKAEAVAKTKELMTEQALDAHMALKHPGQQIPPLSRVHSMIEDSLEPIIELKTK